MYIVSFCISFFISLMGLLLIGSMLVAHWIDVQRKKIKQNLEEK